MKRIRVFRYLPEVDAFDVNQEYRAIAEDLGLIEWNPVVWIGRLFALDNDFGEHWFDNWDQRDERREAALALGLDADELLVIDPERFQDGIDGPCNPPEIRALFWKSVLESLELSIEVICEEARHFNARTDGRPELRSCRIEDLEERITRWRQQYSC